MDIEEKDSSYFFSFNCQEDIEHFNIIPREAQEDIEIKIVKVIFESYVVPADEDYITSRILALKRRYRAFFWASAQAVEKYLKSFLLLRGVSVKDKSHGILSLYDSACMVDETIKEIKCEIHPRIKIHENSEWIFRSLEVREFLDILERCGSPNNRYNSFGVEFSTAYLFFLDSFIFFLRRKIGVTPINLILNEMDADFIESFHHYNPWFFDYKDDLPMIPNENMILAISDAVTTLEILIRREDSLYNALALQWLKKKMCVPTLKP